MRGAGRRILLGPLLAGCLLWLVLAPLAARAGCSPAVGDATLNEYFFGTDTNFIEILIHNNAQVPQAEWSTWQVRVYDAAGAPRLSYFLNDLNVQVCPAGGKTYLTYPVAAGLPGGGSTSVNVVLLDGADEVDYLKFKNNTPIGVHYTPSCGTFAYDTDAVVGSSGNKDIGRFPDGSGEWRQSSEMGANTTYTNCSGNDASILKAVSTATVVQGGTAFFSITVSNPDSTRSITSASVSDLLPTGLSYVIHSVTGGSYDKDTGLWTIGTLLPSSSVTLTLTFSGDTLGSKTNTATLTYTNNRGVQTASDTAVVEVVANTLDHLRLAHSGTALTCQRADVTVTACQDAACLTHYTAPFSVTLAPGGWVGGDTQTLSDGAVVQLRRNSPGTATLAASLPYQCWQGGVAGSCDLLFYDSGFLFDVPDLTACQGSGNVVLSAVRKDLSSSRCVAAGGFAGQSKILNFWSSYLAPAGGSRTLAVNGTALATAAPGTPLTLTFDGNAQTTITARYDDAGRLQLDARYNGSGEEAGLVMAGADTLAVRPAELRLSATGSGTPLNNATATGNPHWPAGSDFTVEVRATCADGTVTPNFAAPVQLTASNLAPAGGVTGTLANSLVPTASFSNGVASATTVSYGEVGSLTLNGSASDYLAPGATVSAGATTVGRFTPYDFAATLDNTPELTPGCGGLTYLGQSFGYATAPQVTITARNRSGGTTQNYDGNWWKLADFAEAYSHDGGALPAGVTLSAGAAGHSAIDCSAGTCDGRVTTTFDGSFSYSRPVVPVLPFAAALDIAVPLVDGDGIAYAGNPFRIENVGFSGGNASQRYGRIRLFPAYGAELFDLAMPLRAESYVAPGHFATESGDICTTLALTLGAVAGSVLQPADTCVQDSGAPGLSGAGCAVAGPAGHLFVEPPLGGAFNLWLRAPASGQVGSVAVTAAVPAWLHYDWNGDGALENPAARATFGIYKGSPKLIYRREGVP